MQHTSCGHSTLESLTIEPELLLEWWHLCVATLRRSQYKAIAEDVASILTVKRITHARRGHALTACPKGLSGRFKQEALRIARQESGVSATTNLDCSMVSSPDPNDGDEPIDSDLMMVLERIFTRAQIEGMVERCRMGTPGRKDLAEASGLSQRTFYSRVCEVHSKQRE